MSDLLNYCDIKQDEILTQIPSFDLQNVRAKCSVIKKLLLERDEQSDALLKSQTDELQKIFNSEYMEQQIKSMYESLEKHPADSIGKAKELIESCCKTVLEHRKIDVDKNWTVQQLTKNTCNQLKLTPENIDETDKASRTIQQLLNHLSAISVSVAELRNAYGTGHGKSISYNGLEPRHARLAVGASTALVQFLWDTHKAEKDN